MRLWVTRARPGAAATAERLTALGHEPVVQPLLQVREIGGGPIDLAGVAALAFTSANAVAAFARRSPDSAGGRRLPVFTVGDATAAAARAAGFADVTSAAGDVEALAHLLTTRAADLAGAVLYGAAAEPARDLAALLAESGATLRQLALYRTAPILPPPDFVADVETLDGVLLHSARAAAGLAAWLSEHPAPRLSAYAMSPQIADALASAGFARVAVAGAPNEAALLALLVP